jgi:hypothetical protein
MMTEQTHFPTKNLSGTTKLPQEPRSDNRKNTEELNCNYTPNWTDHHESENTYSNNVKPRYTQIQDKQRIIPRLEPFKGSGWTVFIEKFENLANSSNWNHPSMLEMFPLFLKKQAAAYYQVLSRDKKRTDYEWLKSKFEQHFGKIGPSSTVRMQLATVKQYENESLRKFLQIVLQLVGQAWPEANDEMRESMTIDAFVKGMVDKKSAQAIIEQRIKTIDEALKLS